MTRPRARSGGSCSPRSRRWQLARRGCWPRREERIAAVPVPDGELVLVHADMWQGNTVWNGDSRSGMIDWDAAGAGSPGIDLGTLRLDVALLFGSSPLAASGLPAAGEVLAGWQHAAGRPARDVAHWDVAAALCTVGDMARCTQSPASRHPATPEVPSTP